MSVERYHCDGCGRDLTPDSLTSILLHSGYHYLPDGNGEGRECGPVRLIDGAHVVDDDPMGPITEAELDAAKCYRHPDGSWRKDPPKEPQDQPDVLANSRRTMRVGRRSPMKFIDAQWRDEACNAIDVLARELETEREEHKRTMNNKEIWRQRTEMLEKREGKAEQRAESIENERADWQRRHQDVSERAEAAEARGIEANRVANGVIAGEIKDREAAERALEVEREAHADCDRGHVEQLQAAELALEIAIDYIADGSKEADVALAEIAAAQEGKPDDDS